MIKTKHHILITVVLFVAIIFFGFNEHKDYYVEDNTIIWSIKMLEWENFTKVDELEEEYVANITSDIYCPNQISWFNSKVYAFMDPNRSERLHDSMLGEQVLIHEQYHFNITEYHARLLRKDIVTIDDFMRQTAYYENPVIHSYYNFKQGKTNIYRHVYKTENLKILTSYPINKEEMIFGESYKVFKNRNKIIVSFYKNGVLTNGVKFSTAITMIKKEGDLTLVSYHNPDKSLNTTLDHCKVERFESKTHVTYSYYDFNGQRVLKKGVFETKWAKNSDGTINSTYFDINKKLINNEDGVAHEKRRFDDQGRTIEIASFGHNNKPKNDKDYGSLYKFLFDSYNKIIKYEIYDENGDFAIYLNSYNHTYLYDERGNNTQTINLDENNNRDEDKDGVGIYKYLYDKYDNYTSSKIYNRNMVPVLGTYEYHEEVKKFDSIGRLLYEGFFYPGHVLSFSELKWGATKYLYPNDSIIFEQNVDVFNEKFNNSNGIATIKKYIDNKKQVTKEVYLNANGDFANTSDGIVENRYIYDPSGNKIENSSLDSLGHLKPFEADVSIIRWKYDQKNNKTKTTYFRVDGELADANQNVTYNVYVYNDKNQLVERLNFNRYMKPQLLDGVFRSKFYLNKKGLDSIMENYGTNNRYVEGVSRTLYHYNKYDEIVAETYLNENNDRVYNEVGVNSIQNYYNENFNYIGNGFFDIKGKKVNNTKGYSYDVLILDEIGYLLSKAYFDKLDRPAIGPDSYHKVEYTWDSKREIVKESTYGIDGRLIENDEGIAEYIYTRNEAGLISSIKRFDKNKNLTNGSTGIAEYYYKNRLNGLYYLEKTINKNGEEVKIE